MQNVFHDKNKLNMYAKIQNNLTTLSPNSTDEQINEIFEDIPKTFFEEKENLIVVCQIFAMLGRSRRLKGRITIKLFDNIIVYIRKHLQEESWLFWNIFGSCMYFKYWMYKEGLITIDQIIYSSQSDRSSLTAQYFLPDILEHDPDVFHKDIKYRFSCFSTEDSYSAQKIENLRKLREEHLKWLKNSGDYHDEKYSEIEKDPLRLSIKRDDFSSFQIFLSQTNLPIDSTIEESLIEHFLLNNDKVTLIQYAAIYCASTIFKFLLLKGAKVYPNMMHFVFQSDNYDMIHAVEKGLEP